MKTTKLAIILLSILLLGSLTFAGSFIILKNDRDFIDVISEKNGYAIKVDTVGAIISGLDIRNSGPGLYTTGIKVVASHVTIENCNVFDTPVGIAIWTSNNIIVNCTFWRCQDEGIVILGGTPLRSNNNTFINCVFYYCCDGIELQESSNNKFINCWFINNYHAGIDGIHHDNNNNLVISCVFLDNVYGVYFKQSRNNELVNCTFMDNEKDIWDNQ